jgi:hypothetical protein
MTVDEELTHLEDAIRKLKIEYDIYFNGGTSRPPTDAQWRVESVVKKYSDASRLSFAHRFRYNSLVQRYAMFSDMWRQKVKAREEGREPPRRREEPRPEPGAARPSSFAIQWTDPEQEQDKVERLFNVLVEAKKRCGEAADSLPMDTFKRFVKQKTEQLKKEMACQQVEYVVEIENGQVRLKARGSS